MFASNQNKTTMRVVVGLTIWALYSWLAPTALAQKAYDPDAMPGAEYADRGAETCLRCHDEAPVTHILYTKHAQQADERTWSRTQPVRTPFPVANGSVE